MQSNWRHVGSPFGSPLDVLNRNLASKSAAVPSFADSRTLLVGSDYSGESKEEPYVVYSFILAGDAGWASWEEKRVLLRSRIMPDRRRMSYKKLGDKYRNKFLRPILDAADEIDGISISLALSKAAPSLFPTTGPLDLSNPEFHDFLCWKGDVLQKAFTILHLVSFLVAGVSHERQDLLWFTDQDEIAANAARLTLLTKAFSWVSSSYLGFNLGHVRCGTTQCDNGSCQIEDFVAIPDLIAGALSEQFRSASSLGAPVDGGLWLTGTGMKDKAQSILFWYATRQKRLKKHVFVIDPGKDGNSHKISWFNFTHEAAEGEHLT